jgi:hypothetical protein
MKVASPTRSFNPVTITLETQEEYATLRDLLSLSIGQMRALGLEKHYEGTESMFDALTGLEN